MAACDERPLPLDEDTGDCSDAARPLAHGSIFIEEKPGRDVAHFTCDEGFVLRGASYIQCGSLGFRACVPRVYRSEPTGLDWENEDHATLRTQAQAAEHCADLDLEGRTDWRLPTAREAALYLATLPVLSEDELGTDPANGIVEPTWTSTPAAVSGSFMTITSAALSGRTSGVLPELSVSAPDALARTRCVQGDVLDEPSLSAPGDGTVVDASTGLVWYAPTDGLLRTHLIAQGVCAAESAELRLPSLAEVLTLARLDGASTLDAAFFSQPADAFWTSEPTRVSSSGASSSFVHDDALELGVLCVR